MNNKTITVWTCDQCNYVIALKLGPADIAPCVGCGQGVLRPSTWIRADESISKTQINERILELQLRRSEIMDSALRTNYDSRIDELALLKERLVREAEP